MRIIPYSNLSKSPVPSTVSWRSRLAQRLEVGARGFGSPRGRFLFAFFFVSSTVTLEGLE